MLTDDIRLDDAAIAALRGTVTGRVIDPDDEGYDESRSVWNGAIDRRPAVVVRAVNNDDVAATIAFARSTGRPLTIRGGGHNVSGSAVADGGVMLHFGDRREVLVDAPTRRVIARPGATMVDVDTAADQHRLGVSAGVVTHTGIAGLTLGGGIGWLMRRDGLSIDRLRAATLVTADGDAIRASDEDHPDLFWAIRGGGGNFGVVTGFEYEAAPLDAEVTAGSIFFDQRDTGDVLRRFREWAAQAPDAITTILTLRTMLPLPTVPTEVHGVRVLSISLCHSGSVEDGERDVARLRRFGRPLADTIGRRSYLVHQRAFDPVVPWGHGYYWKSVNLPDLTDAAIEHLAQAGSTASAPWSYVILFQLGGAVARVPADATAYPDRSAGYTVNINGVWVLPEEADGAPDRTAWVREVYAALEPHSTGASYVNFLMAEGDDLVHRAYGPAYERLATIKATYDPDNVFRSNQNVRPGAG
jgi:FAD/FMN-containing dehydrogenase